MKNDSHLKILRSRLEKKAKYYEKAKYEVELYKKKGGILKTQNLKIQCCTKTAISMPVPPPAAPQLRDKCSLPLFGRQCLSPPPLVTCQDTLSDWRPAS
jgi:hypothetical protein